MATQVVQSADGTSLLVERQGAGVPLVLLHGTIGDRTDWHQVLTRLAGDFDVAAYDRRGRGGSTDGDEYSIDREIDDACAVVEGLGPPVHVVGHSFGAVIALLLTARHPELVRTLVIYEPPIGAGEGNDNEFLADIDAALDAADREGAVAAFLRATGATDAEVGATRANQRAWASMCDAVGTVAREVRAAAAELPLSSDLVGRIGAPTLVLLGADQDAPTYGGLRDLVTSLPHGELERVPGRHLAIIQAPDEFVSTVVDFFARHPT